MGSSPQEKYCLDTNIWISFWRYYYPKDVFPSFWDKIEESIKKGIFRSPMEVYYELEKGKDELFEWLKERKEVFYEFDSSQQQHLTKILEKFPKLVDSEKTTPDADPFVIAMAIDQKLVVVTMEKLRKIDPNNKDARPKIPNVCDHFSVLYINELAEFLRKLGWTF